MKRNMVKLTESKVKNNMKKNIVKLTESDLNRIVRKIVKEQQETDKQSLITSLQGFISLLEKEGSDVTKICKSIVDTCSKFSSGQNQQPVSSNNPTPPPSDEELGA